MTSSPTTDATLPLDLLYARAGHAQKYSVKYSPVLLAKAGWTSSRYKYGGRMLVRGMAPCVLIAAAHWHLAPQV